MPCGGRAAAAAPCWRPPIRSSCARSRPGWRRCWGSSGQVPHPGDGAPLALPQQGHLHLLYRAGPAAGQRHLRRGHPPGGAGGLLPAPPPRPGRGGGGGRRAARLCRYEPYQEDRGTGLVRHVLVRHSRATGRVLVALVTAAPVLPGARAFVSKVRELCPRVETIVQNINPRRSSAVLGPREKVLWGRGYIEDTLCEVRFRLGASSFYQINPEQTEVTLPHRPGRGGAGRRPDRGGRLLRRGHHRPGGGGPGQAGAGGGVQPQRGPVRRPERPGQRRGQRPLPLRRRHGLPPGHGRPGRAGGRGVPGPAPGREHPGVPGGGGPHGAGADRSTSPATRRRSGGIRRLAGWGWRARLLQPVDRFPHTEHVECVAALAGVAGGGM